MPEESDIFLCNLSYITVRALPYKDLSRKRLLSFPRYEITAGFGIKKIIHIVELLSQIQTFSMIGLLSFPFSEAILYPILMSAN